MKTIINLIQNINSTSNILKNLKGINLVNTYEYKVITYDDILYISTYFYDDDINKFGILDLTFNIFSIYHTKLDVEFIKDIIKPFDKVILKMISVADMKYLQEIRIKESSINYIIDNNLIDDIFENDYIKYYKECFNNRDIDDYYLF